jgi:ribosomal protein L34
MSLRTASTLLQVARLSRVVTNYHSASLRLRPFSTTLDWSVEPTKQQHNWISSWCRKPSMRANDNNTTSPTEHTTTSDSIVSISTTTIMETAIWLIKRTFQPSIIRKNRKMGFLVRHRTVGGRRTLNWRKFCSIILFRYTYWLTLENLLNFVLLSGIGRVLQRAEL